MAIDRFKPPHPATVVQQRPAPAAPPRPPHPATLERRPLPHPATIAQQREAPRAEPEPLPPHPATRARRLPPHPATIAQRREGPHPATRERSYPPHPATRPATFVLQRSQLESPPEVSTEPVEVKVKVDKSPKKRKAFKRPPPKAQAPILVIEKYNFAIQGNEEFQKLVVTLIEDMEKVKLGEAILAELAGAPGATEWDEKKVTVAVLHRDTEVSPEPIRTDSFDAWNKNRTRKHGKTVPIINFPGVGMTFPKARDLTTVMTKEGPMILKHMDFPDGTPMAVALFHELCHAYYWQLGATKEMQGEPDPKEGLFQTCIGKANPVDARENTEEQLVSGLLAGKGLRFCENSFRAEAGLPPRTGYRTPTVSIEDAELIQDVEEHGWPEAWARYRSSVREVLRVNGYTEVAKKY